jgi:uncharacterized protein (TIGR03066 family)
MRRLFGCATVLALSCAAIAGQAKIDTKMLVGKWEPVPDKDKKEKPPAMVIEFTADGKLSMTVGEVGKEFRAEGTYKLEGDNKLAVSLKVADKEIKETLTVKKLTAGELVTEDSKNKTESLRKKP